MPFVAPPLFSLELALFTNHPYVISQALDMINHDLTMIEKDSLKQVPDAVQISTLTNLLNKLSPDHTIIINSINVIMNKILDK